MVRSNVQDTDVQHFRSRIEAFGRRQSNSQSGSDNPRKRPSQTEYEDYRPKIQRLDAELPESVLTPIQRPQTLFPQRGHPSQDEISELGLPSPATNIRMDEHFLGGSDRLYNPHHYQYVESEFQRSPVSMGDERENFSSQQPYRYEKDLTTLSGDQFEDCDLLSTSVGRASQMTWSGPSTPDGSGYRSQSATIKLATGVNNLTDLSGLEEHERNLIFALAQSEKQDAALAHLRQSPTSVRGSVQLASPYGYESSFESPYAEVVHAS